jgi:hypothetical protein
MPPRERSPTPKRRRRGRDAGRDRAAAGRASARRDPVARRVFSEVLGDPEAAADRLAGALSSGRTSLAEPALRGRAGCGQGARQGGRIAAGARRASARRAVDVQSTAPSTMPSAWLERSQGAPRPPGEIGPEALGMRDDPSAFAAQPR